MRGPGKTDQGGSKLSQTRALYDPEWDKIRIFCHTYIYTGPSHFFHHFMDIHCTAETNSESESIPPKLGQFQVVLQSSSSISGSNTGTSIPSLSILSFNNEPPLLPEHKRRGTAAEYTNEVLIVALCVISGI